MYAKKMETSEMFQVATIVEKLLSRWNNFKNYLKHKQKEMTVVDLIVRLHIEKDNRKSVERSVSTANEIMAMAN